MTGREAGHRVPVTSETRTGCSAEPDRPGAARRWPTGCAARVVRARLVAPQWWLRVPLVRSDHPAAAWKHTPRRAPPGGACPPAVRGRAWHGHGRVGYHGVVPAAHRMRRTRSRRRSTTWAAGPDHRAQAVHERQSDQHDAGGQHAGKHPRRDRPAHHNPSARQASQNTVGVGVQEPPTPPRHERGTTASTPQGHQPRQLTARIYYMY